MSRRSFAIFFGEPPMLDFPSVMNINALWLPLRTIGATAVWTNSRAIAVAVPPPLYLTSSMAFEVSSSVLTLASPKLNSSSALVPKVTNATRVPPALQIIVNPNNRNYMITILYQALYMKWYMKYFICWTADLYTLQKIHSFYTQSTYIHWSTYIYIHRVHTQSTCIHRVYIHRAHTYIGVYIHRVHTYIGVDT